VAVPAEPAASAEEDTEPGLPVQALPDTGHLGSAADEPLMPVADSSQGAVNAPPAALPPPPSGDSGSLKIVGLPAGSSVLLDGEPILSAVTRLPAGRHTVAISAPLHNFYEEQIDVVADDLYELQPVLVKQGVAAPATARRAVRQRRLAAAGVLPSTCGEPGPTYNADRSCYDIRPRPVEAARVPLPQAVANLPAPSTVLVKVSAEGYPIEVKGFRPSSDEVFERLARNYMASARWQPATKGGKAVEGWTTWTVVGVRSGLSQEEPR
jgi:hypothetical protein